MPATEALMGKINALPAARRSEVEDFVDFISRREQDGAVSRIFAAGGASAFAAVWDNADDDVYDSL